MKSDHEVLVEQLRLTNCLLESMRDEINNTYKITCANAQGSNDKLRSIENSMHLLVVLAAICIVLSVFNF
jgi:hypothetical protein